MDVTLDANIYLSDPRMEGISFKSLLDYLRMTGSRLILPKLVLDEVIARYPEKVLPHFKRAISESSSLRNLVFVARVRKIPEPDIARETRSLKLKLLKPSKYVKATPLKDFRGISIEEIARRGVHRIPPANSAGEELRDVITWLMVLKYAENSKREVAFITSDKHFGLANMLHPQMAKEVRDRKVILKLYGSIDEFIKAHAPAPQALPADRAFELLGKSQVLDRFEIAARTFFPRYWRDATSFEVVSRDVRFSRGSLYDVGADSQFAEAEFSGNMKIQVTFPKLTVFPGTGFGGIKPQEIEWYGDRGLAAANVVTLWPKIDTGFSQVSYPYKTVPLSPLADASYSNSVTAVARPLNIVENTDFVVTGTLIISMRLVSSRVTQVEIENFELTEVSESRSSPAGMTPGRPLT